jgi:murein L,D-transpeptidase YcbB/YkuD
VSHLTAVSGVVGCWLALVTLGSSVARPGQTAQPGPTAQPGEAVAAALAEVARRPGLDVAILRDVEALYGPAPRATVWLDGSGRPLARASAAIAVLGRADDDGLAARDYDVPALTGAIAALSAATAPDAAWAARIDVGLSTSLVTYLHHLHSGRIDPLTLGYALEPLREEHDVAGLIRLSLASGHLEAAAAALRPPIAQYGQLRSALTRYRALSEDPALAGALPAAVVHPGDRYAGLAALAARLAALGDLGPGTRPQFETYDGELVDAVKRFQSRHGLDVDGVIGHATLGALNVAPAARVRQIALSLERLRWLPDLRGRMIGINIPMFHLWAWTATGTETAAPIESRIIVGRAVRTRTPIFVGDLARVIFRPFWNVPTSIVRGEILPRLARDPGYPDREALEIVRGAGDDATVLPPTPEHLAALGRGELRLRQRQGSANALGLVKFDLPNVHDVYLHGTPAHQLFARSRRDFSHGCIRVEAATDLAVWTLSALGDWPRERIVAAMQSNGPPIEVRLPEPVTVLIYYTTAIVAADGTIRFADDIYGHDARLARALGADGTGGLYD